MQLILISLTNMCFEISLSALIIFSQISMRSHINSENIWKSFVALVHIKVSPSNIL